MTIVIRIIGGLLLVAALVVIGAGLLGKKEFTGTISDTLDASPETVWALIGDPKERQLWLPIEKVSLAESAAKRLPKWEEQYTHGGWARYEILNSDPPVGLTLGLMDSDTGLRGLWTYTLTSSDGVTTTLSIQEKSRRSDGFFKRGISAFTGGNRVLHHQMNALKKAIQKGVKPALTQPVAVEGTANVEVGSQ